MFIQFKSGNLVNINQIAYVGPPHQFSFARHDDPNPPWYYEVTLANGFKFSRCDEQQVLRPEHALLAKLLTRSATIEQWETAMGYGE